MTVTVGVGPEGVDVVFAGIDRVWALSKGILLPYRRITGVEVMDRRAALQECPGPRLPGTHLPGRIHAGSYGVGARRQLWCARRAPEVLAIDLSGRPYARVVVEVAEPASVRARIAGLLAR